jgi:hypothetical protein
VNDQPDRIIEVFCDDPRHARGKIAKVVTLTVSTDGRLWSLDERKPRRFARSVRKEDNGHRDIRPDPIRCKLCGRELPAQYLGRPLRRAARRLADDGVPTISLAQLVVVSKASREAL